MSPGVKTERLSIDDALVDRLGRTPRASGGPAARLQSAARFVGPLSAILGASVLIGWLLDLAVLVRVNPDWPAMAPAVALGFVLSGVSLWSIVQAPRAGDAKRDRRYRSFARVSASLVLMAGGLRFAFYLAGLSTGLDRLWFLAETLPASTRIAPMSAAGFVFLGLALLLASRPRYAGVFQVFAFASILVGWLGFSHFIYGGEPLRPFAGMAAHSALLFFALGGGVLCSRPDGGLARLLASDGVGGRTVRRLLPAALVLPIVLGWLRLLGQRAGWYGTEEGLALYAMTNVALFGAFVWFTAVQLRRADLARERTADELRASLQEVTNLKTALDEHAIVAITDPHGRISYVNDKFCDISKYTRAELLGQDHRIVNSGSHPKEFFRDLWGTIGRGHVWRGEIKNRAKDGSFYWVATTIVPFLGENGKPVQYVAIRADITEQKRAEEMVHALNADLERRVAERTTQLESANRELEAFSYSISHDLRAPLRAVDGFSLAVLEDYSAQLPPEGHRYLQVIRQGAQQMGALIDDLLAFSRLSRQEVRRRRVDTNKLVAAVLEELGAPWRNRQVEVHVADLPDCDGDVALLKQVWVNLLSNALKYTGRREVARIEIGSQTEHGAVTFFVRDNGTGFDMRYVGKLFGVFQRLHRAEEYEGTGVGLAIVQRIVHRHGGHVWAQGEPDRGAAFFFTLPPEVSHERNTADRTAVG